MISIVHHLARNTHGGDAGLDRMPMHLALIIFSVTFIFIGLINPAVALRDADTFWHIRTGQWILDHYQWPYADPFSYTFYGKPWIAKEWLSQVFLAAAFNFGGWHAVVLLTAAVYAAIAAVLTLYVTQFLRLSFAIALVLVTCLLLTPHFLARPHLFAYLIFSLWLFLLLDAYDNRRTPPLVLAGLMLLWANIHSSFVLGLAVFYVVSAFISVRAINSRDARTLKRVALILLLVTIAACTTPYGISPLLLTWRIMGMKSMMAHLVEWQPPNFRDYPIYLAYLLALFALFSAFGIKLRTVRLALLMIAVWLGFSSTRGFNILLLIVPFIVARPAAHEVVYFSRLNRHGAKRTDPVLRFLETHGGHLSVAGICLVVVSAILLSQLKTVEPPGTNAPKDAIKFAAQAGISGNVFNSYGFGGYLIFKDIPTFIDGRVDLYGDQFFNDYFAAVNLSDIGASYNLLDRYKIAWVLLEPNARLSHGLRLNSNDWTQVFSDKDAVVFVRVHN